VLCPFLFYILNPKPPLFGGFFLIPQHRRLLESILKFKFYRPVAHAGPLHRRTGLFCPACFCQGVFEAAALLKVGSGVIAPLGYTEPLSLLLSLLMNEFTSLNCTLLSLFLPRGFYAFSPLRFPLIVAVWSGSWLLGTASLVPLLPISFCLHGLWLSG